MYLLSVGFVVNLLSQLNRSWAWLTNAPMPQPLSVFGRVVKATCALSCTAYWGDSALVTVRILLTIS